MGKVELDVLGAEGKPDKTTIKKIGDTTFTVNSFFCGKETLENILRRIILRDLERIDDK